MKRVLVCNKVLYNACLDFSKIVWHDFTLSAFCHGRQVLLGWRDAANLCLFASNTIV